jgi:hypothetical protein
VFGERIPLRLPNRCEAVRPQPLLHEVGHLLVLEPRLASRLKQALRLRRLQYAVAQRLRQQGLQLLTPLLNAGVTQFLIARLTAISVVEESVCSFCLLKAVAHGLLVAVPVQSGNLARHPARSRLHSLHLSLPEVVQQLVMLLHHVRGDILVLLVVEIKLLKRIL